MESRDLRFWQQHQLAYGAVAELELEEGTNIIQAAIANHPLSERDTTLKRFAGRSTPGIFIEGSVMFGPAAGPRRKNDGAAVPP